MSTSLGWWFGYLLISYETGCIDDETYGEVSARAPKFLE